MPRCARNCAAGCASCTTAPITPPCSSPTTRKKPSSWPTGSPFLNQGQIEQVGTPKEIIEGPATDFIDHFVDEANAAKYDVAAAQHVVAFRERRRFVSRW